MSEFTTVTTKDDLESLNDSEMVAGYLAGFNGCDEPGNSFSRSYWHGWRNGAVDGKQREIDGDQRQLANVVVARHMRMH